MPQIIEVSGLGELEFPDGMSDADIASAIDEELGRTKQVAQPQIRQPGDLLGESARTIPTISDTTAGGPRISLPTVRQSLVSFGEEVQGLEPNEGIRIPGLSEKVKELGEQYVGGLGMRGVWQPIPPEQFTPTQKLASGAIQGADELVEGVAQYLTSTPGVVETFAAKTPIAPAVFLKWAKDMVEGGMISAGEAYDAYKRGDWETFGKHVVSGLGMLAGATGAAKHGLTKTKQVIKDFTPVKKAAEQMAAKPPPIEPIVPPKPRPTFRGTSISEWEAVKNGDTFGTTIGQEKDPVTGKLVGGQKVDSTWVIEDRDYAQRYASRSPDGVVIEFKPSSRSKMSTVIEDSGPGVAKDNRLNGRGLTIDDVAKVYDAKGNVIYDSAKPSTKPAPTPLSQRPSTTLLPRSEESAPPRPQRSGRDTSARDARRDLKDEGVTPENTEALLSGKKTPQQVVDEQLGVKQKGTSIDADTIIVEENADGSRSIGFSPEAGPASTTPVNIGQMSHGDAIQMAREQGVARITEILSQNKTAPPEPSAAPAAEVVPVPPKPPAPTAPEVVPPEPKIPVAEKTPPAAVEAAAAEPVLFSGLGTLERPVSFWKKFATPLGASKMGSELRSNLVRYAQVPNTHKAIANFIAGKIEGVTAPKPTEVAPPQPLIPPAEIKGTEVVGTAPAIPTKPLDKPIQLSPEDKADVRMDEPGITRRSKPNTIVIQLRDLESRPIREVEIQPSGDPMTDAQNVVRRIRQESANDSRVSLRESAANSTDANGMGILHFTDSPNGPAFASVRDLIEARKKTRSIPSETEGDVRELAKKQFQEMKAAESKPPSAHLPTPAEAKPPAPVKALPQPTAQMETGKAEPLIPPPVRSISEIQKQISRTRAAVKISDPTKKKGKEARARLAALEEELRQSQSAEQPKGGVATYWSRESKEYDIRKVRPTQGADMGERVKLANGQVWEYRGISGYRSDNLNRVNGWERVDTPPPKAPPQSETAQPTPPPQAAKMVEQEVKQVARTELQAADDFAGKASSEAEKATVAWATHVEDVVNPLKAKIRKIQSEVGQMAGDAKRTLPETKGKSKLTKKAFLQQYGVNSMDEANALYKRKNAEWAELEKQLEAAEVKRRELELAKERRGKEWSSAATRAGELRRQVYPKVKEGDVGQPPPAAPGAETGPGIVELGAATPTPPAPPASSPFAGFTGWTTRAKEALQAVKDYLTPPKAGALPEVVIQKDALLPRLPPVEIEKQIASSPQGMARVPGLGATVDPRAVAHTPDDAVFLGRANSISKGNTFATIWAQTQWRFKNLFQADPNDGTILLADGKRGYMEDVIRAELQDPGSQPLTHAQWQWVHNEWVPIRNEVNKMLKEEGIKKIVTEEMEYDPKNDYFPRPAIGKRNREVRGAGGKPGGRPGARQFFQKGRKYATEAEGARLPREGEQKEVIIYDPNAISRVTKFISGAYRAVADHRMANDPALGAGTVPERWGIGRRVFAGPAFQGKIYPEATARKIERAFAQEVRGWVKTTGDVTSAAKAMMATADVSAPFIQGAAMFGRHPKRWASATLNSFKALADPNHVARLMEHPRYKALLESYSQSGGSLFQLKDFLEGMGEGQLATRIPVWGKVLKATGRAYGTFLDMAKLELFDAWSKVTPKSEWPRLVETIENSLFMGRMEQVGLNPHRAIGERLLLFAPSYYRGAGGLISTAFQKSASGKMARQMLGGYAAAGMLVTLGAYAALGLDEQEIRQRLDPARGKFLKVPVDLGNGDRVEVGFGNILTQLVRLAGQAADYHTSDKPIDTGVEANPYLRFLRGRAAFLPNLGIELATGRDYFGQRISAKESTARHFMPFVLQSMFPRDKSSMTQNTADAVFTFFGLNAYPESEYQKQLRSMDRVSFDTFGRPFSKATPAQRARIMAEFKRRPDYVKREPTTTDMERIINLNEERRRELQSAIGDEASEKLARMGLRLPGYKSTVRVNGQDVPLTEAERQRYQELLAEQYVRIINSLNERVIIGRNQVDRDKFWSDKAEAAGVKARNLLLLEMRRGK